MNKMKRLLALLLAVLMLTSVMLGTLASCNKDEDDSSDNGGQNGSGAGTNGGGNNSGGNASAQTKRVSDSQNPVSDPDFIGISENNRNQFFVGVDFNKGDVCFHIPAD